MTEIETRWTVPQAFVWIRSRNLVTVRKFDRPALTMAELTLSGAFDASDCLRVSGYLMEALRLGRFQAIGNRALLEVTAGEPAYRILGDGPDELIPLAVWQNGGTFTDVLKRGVVAVVPGEAICWVNVTVNADDCIAHWRAPASILEHGRMLSEALDLLEPEDCPPWFLAHPDVATTGLDYAGAEVSVARRVFEGPFGIDHAHNTIATGDGGLTWRAVTVELAATQQPLVQELVLVSVEPPPIGPPAAPVWPEAASVPPQVTASGAAARKALSESRGDKLHRRIREWRQTAYPDGTAKPHGQLATECAKALGLKSLSPRTYRRAFGGR